MNSQRDIARSIPKMRTERGAEFVDQPVRQNIFLSLGASQPGRQRVKVDLTHNPSLQNDLGMPRICSPTYDRIRLVEIGAT